MSFSENIVKNIIGEKKRTDIAPEKEMIGTDSKEKTFVIITKGGYTK